MSYTPVELRHVRVGRSLFGYNRAMVEQVIEDVAQSFEATWRERGELSEKVETMEKQLGELRQREALLTQTLLVAEQAAQDIRERARQEAELILAEAHNEARSIGREAHATRERLVSETHRIEAMLRSALGVVGEGLALTRSEPESTTAAPEASTEPAPAVEAPAAEAAAPEPAAQVPATTEPEPEPQESQPQESQPRAATATEAAADEWPRESTREFEPITLVEAATPPKAVEAPVARPAAATEPTPAPAEEKPVLERLRGASSRDFDWGE